MAMHTPPAAAASAPFRGAASAAASAERATIAADDLVRAAHELQAPAAAMLGLAELLSSDAEAPPTPRQAEQLAHLVSAGRHLVAMVGELLDLSRARAGRLALHRERVDLAQLAREAVAMCHAGAQRPLVRLRIAEGRLPALGDARRVRQVLLNLLSNAVKFNRPGGVVEACVGPGPCIAVSDGGAGMDAAQMARLFRPFERLGQGSECADGSGVGLALSQALAAAMGGSLTVASTPGIGTCVTLTLPPARPPRPAGAPPRAAADEPWLLCIDANPVSALLLQEHVRRRGGPPVRKAGSARDGLALAQAVRPLAVLLDLALPDRHGLELLQDLRDDPRTCDIPVAVLSASVNAEDLRRARALGARACWAKPLDLARLDDLLADLLAEAASPAPDAAALSATAC